MVMDTTCSGMAASTSLSRATTPATFEPLLRPALVSDKSSSACKQLPGKPLGTCAVYCG